MKIKTCLPLLLSLIALNTFAGQDRGGGDLCENQIKIIRDDLASWIRKGGHRDLKFTEGVDASSYEKKMLEAIEKAKISCVSEGDRNYPVEVYGTPKVCRFDRGRFSRPTITCSRNEFERMKEEDQYVLVHHEFAGLADLEKPNRDDSNYSLSNQLSAFLVETMVKRLAVKKPTPPSPGTPTEWRMLDGKEGVATIRNLQETLYSTSFSNCGIGWVPAREDDYSVSCDGDYYYPRLYNIAPNRSTSTPQGLIHVYAGRFNCGNARPSDESEYLYSDASGRVIRSLNNVAFFGGEQQPQRAQMEIIYEFDVSGQKISKVNYKLGVPQKVNRGTISRPKWETEVETKIQFQCDAIH